MCINIALVASYIIEQFLPAEENNTGRFRISLSAINVPSDSLGQTAHYITLSTSAATISGK